MHLRQEFEPKKVQAPTFGPRSPAALVVQGLLAGLVGVAAMTVAEKLEQAVTRRPNSYVPAHTLERLLGLPRKPDRERLLMNWAMHWGQGIALGMARAMMANAGIRGPVGSFMFLNVRLLNDQTLENATGVGAPPWTWPVGEQIIDLLHKAIYAFVTGAVVDRLVHSGRHHNAETQRGSPNRTQLS
ncbi:hypothetical protein ACFQX4_26275 [Roseomonas sp. GCM10028921]